MADIGGPSGPGLSDADRLEAVERLQRHALPGGALSREQLADRIRRVHLAQTRAGIDQVFADLPPWPPAAIGTMASWPTVPPGPAAAPAAGRMGMTALVAVGIVVAVAVVLGLGTLLLLGSGDDRPSGESFGPASTLPSSTTAAPTRPSTPATRPTTNEPSTAPPPPAVPFPDAGPAFKIQRVGQDIQPGRYLSKSPDGSCYWERVSGLGGTPDEVIVNGGTFGHQVIVDVLASDKGLRSQGCDWRPYAAPPAPVTTFDDGDWLVGSDVAPGTYRSQNSNAAALPCWWERARGFSHDFDEIIAYDSPPPGPVTVELHAGERFSSDTCGTWARV